MIVVNKINSFIDLVFTISLFSLVPLICYYSFPIGLSYLLALVTFDILWTSYCRRKLTNSKYQKFKLIANEFKNNANYEIIKPLFNEAAFECLFCLYEVLGEREYQKIQAQELSCEKFQIKDEVVQALGKYFKISHTEFSEVGTLEFVGEFLQYWNQVK